MSCSLGVRGRRHSAHFSDLVRRPPNRSLGGGPSQICPVVTFSLTASAALATVTHSHPGRTLTMIIVAYHYPFVVGPDTHARSHALSVLAAPPGELVDEAQFPATSAGISACDRLGRLAGQAAISRRCGSSRSREPTAPGWPAPPPTPAISCVEAARRNARANRGIGKPDPRRDGARPSRCHTTIRDATHDAAESGWV